VGRQIATGELVGKVVGAAVGKAVNEHWQGVGLLVGALVTGVGCDDDL